MELPPCDTYIAKMTGVEVQAHKIAEPDVKIITFWFHPSLFKIGDYIIVWPSGMNQSVCDGYTFESRFDKKEASG